MQATAPKDLGKVGSWFYYVPVLSVSQNTTMRQALYRYSLNISSIGIEREKKKYFGRTMGRFHEALSFDVVFENPKALKPFLQEERIGTNPCGAIPGCHTKTKQTN